MLEHKHLMSLATIKECNSLHDAAKILNFSLSALSHQIKELEEYYGCTLFIRKTKPIQFTYAGNLILTLAEAALPMFQDTKRKLSEYSESNPSSFNIALECHSCYQWLLPTLGTFRSLWPNVDIDLSAEFNFYPLTKLQTKELDLVITGNPNPAIRVEYHPLFDFELLIGVSPKSPLAKKKFLIPDDIANETIIAYPVEKERLSILNNFLSPAGIVPYRVRTAELTMMIVELASSGRGVCCLPNWAFHELTNSPISTLRIGKTGLYETLYAAYRSEDKNTDFMKDFIRLAKTMSQKKLKGISLYQK